MMMKTLIEKYYKEITLLLLLYIAIVATLPLKSGRSHKVEGREDLVVYFLSDARARTYHADRNCPELRGYGDHCETSTEPAALELHRHPCATCVPRANK
jgi:hypothetical protein